MTQWDLSPDTLNFLKQRGMLEKLSNRPVNYGGSMDYLKAFDGSNYTTGTGPDGALTPEDAQRVKDAGFTLGIIQALIPPPTYPHAGDSQFSGFLARVFAGAGIVIDSYLYWLPGALPFSQKIACMEGISVRQWWVDLEERPNLQGAELTASVRQALSDADAAPCTSGEPAGVYTAWWWFDWYVSRGGDMSVFDGRKLWWVAWDGSADPTQIPAEYHPESIPSNMTLAVKQYAGTSSIAGVGGVDLNVLTQAEGSNLEVNVPEVPQDYRTKFALSGPYDWPGVVANLEGIITELQGEVSTAQQSHTGDTEDHKLTDTLADILRKHGYMVEPPAGV